MDDVCSVFRSHHAKQQKQEDLNMLWPIKQIDHMPQGMNVPQQLWGPCLEIMQLGN